MNDFFLSYSHHCGRRFSCLGISSSLVSFITIVHFKIPLSSPSSTSSHQFHHGYFQKLFHLLLKFKASVTKKKKGFCQTRGMKLELHFILSSQKFQASVSSSFLDWPSCDEDLLDGPPPSLHGPSSPYMACWLADVTAVNLSEYSPLRWKAVQGRDNPQSLYPIQLHLDMKNLFSLFHDVAAGILKPLLPSTFS